MTSDSTPLTPVISGLEAIFFDLDGTLLDTDDLVVEKLTRRLSPLFGQRSAVAAGWLLMQSETPGNALVTVLDALGLDELLLPISDRLRMRRGVYPAKEFRLVPNVEEMILTLRDRYRLGIVTSRSRHHIEAFLARFPSIAEAFEVSCGRQDTRRLKPSPQPVLLAAVRLNVEIGNCLMVGDTPVDIKSGRRAGAWTIGVLCGFGRRLELEKAGAHAIVNTTHELVRIL